MYMTNKQKNQIVLNGESHYFVEDKPRVDNCSKCSLQEVCYQQKNDVFICSIFYNENISNGHFETENTEKE